jgi:hypothetical protein
MTRCLLSSVAVLALVISGCTTWSEEVRTIDFPSASPGLRQVPIGLIDLFVVRTVPTKRDVPILVSLPDEIAIQSKEEQGCAKTRVVKTLRNLSGFAPSMESVPRCGDDWMFYYPSPVVVPPTDVLLAGFRQQGLQVMAYPTVAAAKRAGARLAILGIVTRAQILMPSKVDFQDIGNVQSKDAVARHIQKSVATLAVHLLIVDTQSLKTYWEGSLETTVEDYPKLPSWILKQQIESTDPENLSGYEREAGTGLYEPLLNGYRALLTECYINLTNTLLPRLEQAAHAR